MLEMYGFSQQNTTGGIYGRLEEHSVHLVGRRQPRSRLRRGSFAMDCFAPASLASLSARRRAISPDGNGTLGNLLKGFRTFFNCKTLTFQSSGLFTRREFIAAKSQILGQNSRQCSAGELGPRNRGLGCLLGLARRHRGVGVDSFDARVVPPRRLLVPRINSRIAGATNQVLLHDDANVKTDLPTVHEMRETTSLPD